MKILFVDDEAPVLRGIERMLECTDEDWDADYVGSAAEALTCLQQDHFDVIVSDMKMPRMDGAELLSVVSTRWPETVRIMLSGHATRDAVLRAVEPMHQYLAKPCDPETLRTTVLRACQLRDLLHCEQLQKLIGSMHTIPSVPTLYTEVMQEVESPDGTAAAVGEIVMQDAGMTAKILQITNSAAFGLGRPISSPVQAVSMLGMDIIKSLVLSVGVFRQFDDAQPSGFSIDRLFRHCMHVATLARRIAQQSGCSREAAGEAFTAATLHDIGKLIVAVNDPDSWNLIQELMKRKRLTSCDAERQVLGTDHAAIGAYLLSIWGLPQSLVEAVAFHHQPDANDETELSSLTAVSVANQLVQLRHGENDVTLRESVDRHLAQLGLESSLPRWQALARDSDE